jgi:hypothetical protein
MPFSRHLGGIHRPFLILVLALPCAVSAQPAFVGNLSGAQEVPPVASAGTGFGRVTLSADESSILVSLDFSGLGSNQTLAHIHGPAPAGVNAPVLFDLDPPPPIGTTAGQITNATFAVTPTQVADLRAGLWYFNVHSDNNGGGEIRGQIGADPTFGALLAGRNEVPANASPGSGIALVSLNAAENQIIASASWRELQADQSLAHIHGSAIFGANGSVVFNLDPAPAVGGTSGTTGDLFFAVNAAQVAALKAGLQYVNVHSTTFPGGEVRGQLIQSGARFFTTSLSGDQENPPVVTAATGVGQVVLNGAEDQILASVSYNDLSSNQTLTHIHGPAAVGTNGPVIFDLDPAPPQGGTTGSFLGLGFATTPARIADLRAELQYFNVHSMNNGGGEIRGQLRLNETILADGLE